MFESYPNYSQSFNAQTLNVATQEQVDHEGPIQDVLAWTKAEIIVPQDRDGNTAKPDYQGFIPRSKLNAKLLKAGRIEELINVLFPTSPQTIPMSRPSAETIRRFYLRPFVILLCAGYGKMIGHFLRHQHLRDDHLPFRGCPSDFPVSSGSNEIWQRFNEHQWKFCAVELHFDMGLELGEHDILLITTKTSIASGASAKVSRIEVHPDYDRLREGQDLSVDYPHTYILKTYETPQAGIYHKAEKDAFQMLRNASEEQESNIISYHGGFTRVDAKKEVSFHTIFEFAEHGSLEDYMRETDPPSTSEDIVTFWESFMMVLRGLVVIHGRTPKDALMHHALLLGWHHDIKPTNILVCRNPKSLSKYACLFKIGDLGLSHFKLHIGASHVATDAYFIGTRTYGAPEVYRNPRGFAGLHLNIKQQADIWSTGCVISEVAVWLVHGYQRLEEYRRRRSAEFGKRSTQTRTDCFHDGQERVLDFVEKTHRDLPDSFRKHDSCTGDILDKLVSKMIVAKAEARPSARYAYEQFLDTIGRIKETIDDGSAGGENRLWSTTEQSRLKWPPNLPPGLEPQFWDQAPEAASNQASGLRLGTSFERAQRNLLPKFRAVSDTSIPKATVEISNDRRSNNHIDAGLHNSAPKTSRNNRFPLQNTATHGTHEERQSIPRRETRNLPLESNDDQDPTKTITTFGQSSLNRHYPEGVASHFSHQPHMAQRPDDQIPEIGYDGANERQKATLSVKDALAWKHRRERGQGGKIPREWQLDEIEDRDHVFLVDTADSMAQHQTQVKAIVEALGYIVSPCDPNGMDMYVTWNGTHTKHWKTANVAKFLEQLDKIHLRERPKQPNFALRFADLIDSYQAKLKKKTVLEYLGLPKSPRKLSLYIITDGVWQPVCEIIVERTICSLVELLKEKRLTSAQVGIQFIQVGHDLDGKRKLEKLDCGLDIDWDIVDTTHATGNVLKMIKGAINAWYDEDHSPATIRLDQAPSPS